MNLLLEIAFWAFTGFMAITYGCMTLTLVPDKNGNRFGIPSKPPLTLPKPEYRGKENTDE